MTTSLFDIAADLDTPVSAYLKLKPFQPRFLLESVEGGERLARYSFIGFGDCLEFRLDGSGLRIGSERLPRPENQADLLAALRRTLAAAPHAEAATQGFPLLGGLVGVASYDLVRYFERLPSKARVDDDCPDAHYVAPRSLLVFDHLTRRAALLHAGSEHERQSLRREVIRALRGGLPGPAWAASFSAPDASLSEEEFLQGVRTNQGVHRRRRRLPARAVGALLGTLRPRPVRDLPRAAAAEPVAVHVLLRTRRPHGGRLLARSAREAERPSRPDAPDRRHASARRRRRAGRGARSGAARRPEGELGARDAGRSRAQRPRASGDRRLRPRRSPIARSSATATSCTW